MDSNTSKCSTCPTEKEKLQQSNNDEDQGGSSAGCHGYKGVDTGWAWVVLMASFFSFCLIGGTMYSVGIIHSTLLDMFNESISLTAWAGALHSALGCAGGPLSSALIDRFSCRVAFMTSGVIMVIGYLGTAFAPNIEVAIFTCGVVAGLGLACGYTACIVVVSFNFVRWRSVALGVAASGVGAGIFVLAPIMQISRDYFGTRGFFIILAALVANIVTFGVMCFPSTVEISAHIKRKQEAMKVRESGTNTCCAFLKAYKDVSGNAAVLCLCFGMFSYCLGTMLVYLHLPSYIISKGFSATEASLIVSVSGITNIIGRLLTGLLATWERLDVIVLYAGSMAIVSLATFLYPFYNNTMSGQIVYSAVFGLFLGSCYVVMADVNIKLIGIHYIASAIGLEFFFGGVGALVGPVLAGFIVDTSGSYEQSFIIAAFCILLATVFSAATVCLSGDQYTSETVPEDLTKIDLVSVGKQVRMTSRHSVNVEINISTTKGTAGV